MKSVSFAVLAVLSMALLVPVAGAADDEVEARVRAWMPDSVETGSGVFQYALAYTNLKGRVETVYLWLPAEADRIRGLVLAGDLMMESNFIVDPVIRAGCAEQAIGILYDSVGIINPSDSKRSPGFDQVLADLAEVSNHPELAQAAVMPIGHSAASPTVGTILHWNPERCFAALTYKGAQPIPNDKPMEPLRGIPTLHVQDFVEEYKDRRETGSLGRMNVAEIRAKDAELLSGIIEDNGSKHPAWCFRLTPLIAEFIRASAELRLDENGKTHPVPSAAGALVDKQFVAPRHATAPAAEYEGDPTEAMWYPSLKMARMVTDYNAVQLGKEAQYIAFVNPDTGVTISEKQSPPIRFVGPDEFEVQATFLNKAANPVLPQEPVTHADGPILFAAHGRRLELVAPGRFRMVFHPTAVRWVRISAYNMGDATHRFEEAFADLFIPAPNNGLGQTIDFPEVSPVARGDLPLELKAVSSAGLPVRYTVEYGPAVIEDGNKLVLAEVPACATFPLTIGVWAYQYGCYTDPTVKAAEPVRRLIVVEE